MTIHRLFLVLVTLLIPMAGCQPSVDTSANRSMPAPQKPESNSASRAAQRRALAARDALFQKLVTRLFAAMADGGSTAAIEVCSREAKELSEAVGVEHGVAIGRTSFQLRNPENAPPKWAQVLVDQRMEEPTFVRLPDGGTGALLPINLKSQCLTCHGPAEQIPHAVKSKLEELYPDDQATGFEVGDLRGWFWVVVAAKESSVDRSTTTQQTFALFDRAYIPALALTQQEKDSSTTAMNRLAERWRQLRSELEQAIADDEWLGDISTIDEAIIRAEQQVADGELGEAHESLEVIRDLMMRARRRNGIAYALDTLSDFHSTMEGIVKPAMKFTPHSVSEQNIETLRGLSLVAEDKWEVVESTEFDLPLFGREASDSPKLSQHIADERQAINELQTALAKGDVTEIIAAARRIKPPFAQSYMFFGDFPIRRPATTPRPAE